MKYGPNGCPWEIGALALGRWISTTSLQFLQILALVGEQSPKIPFRCVVLIIQPWWVHDIGFHRGIGLGPWTQVPFHGCRMLAWCCRCSATLVHLMRIYMYMCYLRSPWRLMHLVWLALGGATFESPSKRCWPGRGWRCHCCSSCHDWQWTRIRVKRTKTRLGHVMTCWDVPWRSLEIPEDPWSIRVYLIGELRTVSSPKTPWGVGPIYWLPPSGQSAESSASYGSRRKDDWNKSEKERASSPGNVRSSPHHLKTVRSNRPKSNSTMLTNTMIKLLQLQNSLLMTYHVKRVKNSRTTRLRKKWAWYGQRITRH